MVVLLVLVLFWMRIFFFCFGWGFNCYVEMWVVVKVFFFSCDFVVY